MHHCYGLHHEDHDIGVNASFLLRYAAIGAKPPADAPAAKRRLSFNEKHALETLPKTIEKLHTEIAKQQRRLDDPNLYAKDRNAFDEASNAMAKAQQELAAAEDRWLELEVLREEIEQA